MVNTTFIVTPKITLPLSDYRWSAEEISIS